MVTSKTLMETVTHIEAQILMLNNDLRKHINDISVIYRELNSLYDMIGDLCLTEKDIGGTE